MKEQKAHLADSIISSIVEHAKENVRADGKLVDVYVQLPEIAEQTGASLSYVRMVLQTKLSHIMSPEGRMGWGINAGTLENFLAEVDYAPQTRGMIGADDSSPQGILPSFRFRPRVRSGGTNPRIYNGST